MDVPAPNFAPYDPAKDEPLPWEADVRAAIDKLRAEKEVEEKDETAKTGLTPSGVILCDYFCNATALRGILLALPI
jgi:hypothetical protein